MFWEILFCFLICLILIFQKMFCEIKIGPLFPKKKKNLSTCFGNFVFWISSFFFSFATLHTKKTDILFNSSSSINSHVSLAVLLLLFIFSKIFTPNFLCSFGYLALKPCCAKKGFLSFRKNMFSFFVPVMMQSLFPPFKRNKKLDGVIQRALRRTRLHV